MTVTGLEYAVRHVDKCNRDAGVSHTLLRSADGGVVKMIAGSLCMISPDNLALSLTGAFGVEVERVQEPSDLFVTDRDIAAAQAIWTEAERM